MQEQIIVRPSSVTWGNGYSVVFDRGNTKHNLCSEVIGKQN